MNFGMMAYDSLTEETFVLPEVEQPYLPGHKNYKPLFYLGLSKWTYKEDEGKKSKQVPKPGTLPFYANHFNCIELDSTHQELPTEEAVNKWYKSVDTKDFMFCPKLYKGITQGKVDIHKLGLTKDFINRMKGFKEKLGNSLLELNEDYSVLNKDALLKYLKELPSNFPLSVEIRDKEWISDRYLFDSLVKELNQLNKGLVIADSPGRRDLVHMHLSNSTAFIRFSCRGDHELDLFRIDQWKKQLQSWYLQGLDKCFFFLHIQEKSSEDDFISYAKEVLKFG